MGTHTNNTTLTNTYHRVNVKLIGQLGMNALLVILVTVLHLLAAAHWMHSDGRTGPAGNRNLMPEPPKKEENTDTSQGHLREMLADGSFEKFGVGGLDAEFLTIFRRVFASRMVAPDVVKRLGMRHVKGMLLYGPPGTGKTLVARQLGKLLNAHPPKIVNGKEGCIDGTR